MVSSFLIVSAPFRGPLYRRAVLRFGANGGSLKKGIFRGSLQGPGLHPRTPRPEGLTTASARGPPGAGRRAESRAARVERLERDALLNHYSLIVPVHLDTLKPDERNQVYKMPDLTRARQR